MKNDLCFPQVQECSPFRPGVGHAGAGVGEGFSLTALRSLDSDERIARKDREIANISHRIGFKTK